MSYRKLSGFTSLLIPILAAACAGSLQQATLDLPGQDKIVYATFNAPGFVAPSATIADSFECRYQQKCEKGGPTITIPGPGFAVSLIPGVAQVLSSVLYCTSCPGINSSNSGNVTVTGGNAVAKAIPKVTASGGAGGIGQGGTGNGGAARIDPNAVVNNNNVEGARIDPNAVVNNNSLQGGDARIESGALFTSVTTGDTSVVNDVHGGSVAPNAVVNNNTAEGGHSNIDPNAVNVTTGGTNVVTDVRNEALGGSLEVQAGAFAVDANSTANANPIVTATGGGGGEISGEGLFNLNLAQTLNQGPTTLNGGPTNVNVGPIDISASALGGNANAFSQADASAAAQAAAAVQNTNTTPLPGQPSGGDGGYSGGGHGGDRDRDHD